VETLRGIASLSVLFAHWCTTEAPGWIGSPLLATVFKKLQVGVYVFFAISGFIMPYALNRGGYSVRNFGKFWLKRVVRLDPPYLLSIAFCVLIGYAASLHPLSKVLFHLDWQNLALHLLYLCPFFGQGWVTGGGGVFWTLGIECQYYLVLALFFPLLCHAKGWVRWLTLGLFASSSIWADALRGRFLPPYTPFFAMGITTFWFYKGQIGRWAYLASLCLLTCLAAWWFELYQVEGALGTALLLGFYRRPASPLQFFGKISYSLYLFHAAVALRVVNYCNRFAWGRSWNWLIILGGATGCVLLATGVYYLIERPCRDYSQGIRYRR